MTEVNSAWKQVTFGGEITWVSPRAGLTVQGIIIGRRTAKDRRGKPYSFYAMKLTAATKATVVGKDKAETVKALEPGDVIHFREGAALRDIAGYAEYGSCYEAKIVWREKVEIGGGQSVWRVDSAARQIAPLAKTPVASAPSAGEPSETAAPDAPEGDEDGAPF